MLGKDLSTLNVRVLVTILRSGYFLNAFYYDLDSEMKSTIDMLHVVFFHIKEWMKVMLFFANLTTNDHFNNLRAPKKRGKLDLMFIHFYHFNSQC